MRLAVSFALLASVASFAGALASGCDPDLTPVSTGTPGAADGGGTTTKPPTGSDAGPTTTGDGGTTEDDAGDASTGPTPHVVDGTNDFAPGETFETSSAATATSTAYTAYVSWDATKVYFGMTGADIGATSSQKWLLIYMDGNPGNAGSSLGASFDCSGGCTSVAQQAKLGFSAGFLFLYKTSGDYTRLLKWNGTKFDSSGFDPDVKKSGNFLELSIPRTVLGSPTTLKTNILMSVESPTDAWTYAVVPKSAWTDGRFAPPQTLTKYFAFDLDSTKAPNTFAPLP